MIGPILTFSLGGAPSALLAWGLVSPALGGGYRLYLGLHAPANIDWVTPIAASPAGGGSVVVSGLALDRDVDYYLGVRSLSEAGRESSLLAQDLRVCRVRISAAGVLQGLAPNALTSAALAPGPDGTMILTYRYSARDQGASPATLEVAQKVDGAWDFDHPIDVLSLTGPTCSSTALSPAWPHGTSVQLAARAVAADGSPGAYLVTTTAVADSVAPDQVAWLAAASEDL